jgi:hypothetical protein
MGGKKMGGCGSGMQSVFALQEAEAAERKLKKEQEEEFIPFAKPEKAGCCPEQKKNSCVPD